MATPTPCPWNSSALLPWVQPYLPEEVSIVVDGPCEAPGLREVIKEGLKFTGGQVWDACPVVGEGSLQDLGTEQGSGFSVQPS